MNFEKRTCARCGIAIKNVYKYNNEFYGSECIKKVVNIDISDIAQYTHYSDGIDFKNSYDQCYDVNKYLNYLSEQGKGKDLEKIRQEILYTILKDKDLSNIKSSYKLQVIPSIIEQYEKKGHISEKQYTMANEWLSTKENERFIEMLNQRN